MDTVKTPVTGRDEPVRRKEGHLTYEIKNGKATITCCDGSVCGELLIPDTINGYPVTGIGYEAFSYCSRLTSITIPDGVTSIGKRAFGDCTSLTSITIPADVTYIGIFAFSACWKLTSITIPDSVTEIAIWAFEGCSSLENVVLGNSVTYIGCAVFRDCTSLTEITIPSSVTAIDGQAFGAVQVYQTICNDLQFVETRIYLYNVYIHKPQDRVYHIQMEVNEL